MRDPSRCRLLLADTLHCSIALSMHGLPVGNNDDAWLVSGCEGCVAGEHLFVTDNVICGT